MLEPKDTNKSNSDIFLEYADAYEKTYLDNNWIRLEKFFSSDVAYETASGKRISGRKNLLSYLNKSADNFDRRFESRKLELELKPVISNNIVAVNWKATYKKHGLPDLVMCGLETVTFADCRISHLEDTVDDNSKSTFENWQKMYGDIFINTDKK
jgi:hypothetical protein